MLLMSNRKTCCQCLLIKANFIILEYDRIQCGNRDSSFDNFQKEREAQVHNRLVSNRDFDRNDQLKQYARVASSDIRESSHRAQPQFHLAFSKQSKNSLNKRRWMRGKKETEVEP